MHKPLILSSKQGYKVTVYWDIYARGNFLPKPDAKYCGKYHQIYFRACPLVLISFNTQLSSNRGRKRGESPAWIIESKDCSGLPPLLPFIDHHAVS